MKKQIIQDEVIKKEGQEVLELRGLKDLNLDLYSKLIQYEFFTEADPIKSFDQQISKVSILLDKPISDINEMDWNDVGSLIDSFNYEVPDEDYIEVNGIQFYHPKDEENIKAGESVMINMLVGNLEKDDNYIKNYLLITSAILCRPVVKEIDENTGLEVNKRIPFNSNAVEARKKIFSNLNGYKLRKSFDYFIKKKIG
jgi:hypothetical protein